MTLGAVDRGGVERLVEHALFGPLDLTIRAVQEVPVAIDRARQQLIFARVIGKLAVDQGVREVRRRLDLPGEFETDTPPVARRGRRRLDTTAGLDSAIAERAASERAGPEAVDPDQRVPGPPVAAAEELALPDYEQLPAAHIVAKLAGLQQSDRDAIQRFESSHRHRRTILGKLDQLRLADD